MDNIKNMNTINLNDTVVKLEHVTRTYKIGENEVHALRGVSFEIKQGEFLAIMGPSGSGKSTCMNMIGCLDRPTSGKIQINGKFTSQMTEKELAILRNKTIGFVFQQYHLIPGMSVLENVMLPLKYQKVEKAERKKESKTALVCNDPVTYCCTCAGRVFMADQTETADRISGVAGSSCGIRKRDVAYTPRYRFLCGV